MIEIKDNNSINIKFYIGEKVQFVDNNKNKIRGTIHSIRSIKGDEVYYNIELSNNDIKYSIPESKISHGHFNIGDVVEFKDDVTNSKKTGKIYSKLENELYSIKLNNKEYIVKDSRELNHKELINTEKVNTDSSDNEIELLNTLKDKISSNILKREDNLMNLCIALYLEGYRDGKKDTKKYKENIRFKRKFLNLKFEIDRAYSEVLKYIRNSYDHNNNKRNTLYADEVIKLLEENIGKVIDGTKDSI